MPTTNDKLDALKNLVVFLAEKSLTRSEEEYVVLQHLMQEVEDAFPEKPSDLL